MMKYLVLLILLMSLGCVAVPYHGYDSDYYYPDYSYRYYYSPYYYYPNYYYPYYPHYYFDYRSFGRHSGWGFGVGQ